MKERPILFSGPMVRAILDGRKTQTRRVIVGAPADAELGIYTVPLNCGPGCGHPDGTEGFAAFFEGPTVESPGMSNVVNGRPLGFRCPYGVPGDRLWVKETFAIENWRELFSGRPAPITHYRAGWQGRSVMTNKVLSDGRMEGPVTWEEPQKAPETNWKPSIFMPRTLSRISLEVTGVRVQRVKEIGKADAIAEGVTAEASQVDPGGFARVRFALLWDSLNAKRGSGWDANPWVWAITFRRLP